MMPYLAQEITLIFVKFDASVWIVIVYLIAAASMFGRLERRVGSSK